MFGDRIAPFFDTGAVLLILIALLFPNAVEAIDDGRLCCRYRDKSFKPTGITYIPTLDSLLAVDRSGYTQFVNLTDSKCGARYCGDSARDTPKNENRPWGNLIFEGATTKDDAHIAYLLEGGRTGTGPPKIHFFDLDEWDIFHTVELPEISVTDTKGAGSLVWIPDGHADGRFLVGSHIDGTVYAYRVSSDTSFSTATLIKTFLLEGLPPEAIDMSGMAFDFDARKLFTMFHQGSWTMYAHHVSDDGEVANKVGERRALADMVGGSPPYKHEGIAVYRDRFEGSHHNIFIADANRYIFNIRWRYGSSRLVRCPWVGRRVIGCCFTDKPCQNMATDDCWASGGYYVGKQCEVNTCANTAFDTQIAPASFVLGCPNSTYFEYPDPKHKFVANTLTCQLCDNTNRGGKAGCSECANSLPNPFDPSNELYCTQCHEGYFLNGVSCKPCDDSISMCSSCSLNSEASLDCHDCTEGSTLLNNVCTRCSDETPNCNRCSSNVTTGSITCQDCEAPFYLWNGACASCASQVENCVQCGASPIGAVTCAICGEGYKLHQNECIAECPLGYYATQINKGQEIEPGTGCGSPKGAGLVPVWVCNRCEGDNYNAECSAVPPVPSVESCSDLDWPSNISGENDVICSGAIVNDRCMSGTFTQAQQLCSALGARLCTRGELLRKEGLLSGCDDTDRVWTSSRNDGCGGWYTITAPRFGNTSFADSLCTSSNGGEVLGVQCCADGENTISSAEVSNYPKSNELYDMGGGHATCWLLDWDSKSGQTQACARSQINGMCHTNVTFTEAEEICSSVGSHVCRLEELDGDVALDQTETGCDLDYEYVWSNNTKHCPEGHHLIGGGTNAAGLAPHYKRAQCKPDDYRGPVRCCTYASVEGHDELWDLIEQCVFGIVVILAGFTTCVAEYHTPGASCYGSRPYSDAWAVCDMQNSRLCTSYEISSQSMLNLCGFGEEPVWTLDQEVDDIVCAQDNFITRAGTDNYLWKHPAQCTQPTDLANVVCCQGEVPVDPCTNVTCLPSTNDCTSEARCVGNGTCIEEDVSGYFSDLWACGSEENGICQGQDGICAMSVDPCETVSCFQENECREVGICEAGFCTSPMKADGMLCTEGVCQEGECIITPPPPAPVPSPSPMPKFGSTKVFAIEGKATIVSSGITEMIACQITEKLGQESCPNNATCTQVKCEEIQSSRRRLEDGISVLSKHNLVVNSELQSSDLITEFIESMSSETTQGQALSASGVSDASFSQVTGVEVVGDFNYEISFNSSCTHVSFNDAQGSEELKFCYNISDKPAEMRIFNEDCNTEVTDHALTLVKTLRWDSVPADRNDHIEFHIDVNQSTIQGSNIWAYNDATKKGNITFCMRLDLYADKNKTFSVNFYETVATITVDMSQGFSVEGISTDRDEAANITRSTSTNYTLDAYQCKDTLGTPSNQVMSQASILGLCIDLGADVEGTQFDDVLNLTLTQDNNGVSSTPILSGQSDGLTSVNCEANEGKRCFIQTIVVSKFFTPEAGNANITASGTVLLKFGRRRLNRVYLTLPNDSQKEVQEEGINRFLQNAEEAAQDFRVVIATEGFKYDDVSNENGSSKDDGKNLTDIATAGLTTILVFLVGCSIAVYFIIRRKISEKEAASEEMSPNETPKDNLGHLSPIT